MRYVDGMNSRHRDEHGVGVSVQGFPAFYFLALQAAMRKILQVDGGHGYDVSRTLTETRGLGVCA